MMKAEHNDRKNQPKLTINTGLNPYISISAFAEFTNYMHELKTNYFIVNKIVPTNAFIANLTRGNYNLVILTQVKHCPANIVSVPLCVLTGPGPEF
ncbi:hypothetical protein [Legionella quateirensis]|uniref:LysR family transcriptional regulator n=1 Tax=Legionella quateirensis TaxID=45072 RepID=A0A378KW75_9GAMM|nr:hypothetical protein [Legionella quateirensis]KTD52519.1 LysR family transcriptional regulator [Legionella quateirensis]STY19084.1 LysR family transcriptional regulator [Legionella quateirensis]